jgi:hypothetical protein
MTLLPVFVNTVAYCAVGQASCLSYWNLDPRFRDGISEEVYLVVRVINTDAYWAPGCRLRRNPPNPPLPKGGGSVPSFDNGAQGGFFWSLKPLRIRDRIYAIVYLGNRSAGAGR